MAERITDPPEAPPRALRGWGALPHRQLRPHDGCVRVVDGQQQPRGRAADRLQANVARLGGLTGEPDVLAGVLLVMLIDLTANSGKRIRLQHLSRVFGAPAPRQR